MGGNMVKVPPSAASAPTLPEAGPSASLSRRLSRAELDHTLRDLLADESAPATRLLPEDLYAPYDNDAPTQQASGALVDSLEALAEDVSERALQSATARAALIPCQPANAQDADCYRRVVQGLLPRALRRPVNDAEVATYLPLLDLANDPAQTQANGFDMAVRLLIQALVQDPEFLYRIEAGNAGAVSRSLSDHELATRLSYLLWGTTPDETLLADAGAGRLRSAADRGKVWERMWSDPRAKAQLERFHAMWLGYRAIPHPAPLAAAFARETNALLSRVVFEEPQSYLNLFDFPETYVDATLAEHYGLPRPAQGPSWVQYPEGRAGILSHGSVLSAFGKFSDTSPTQRGIFVRTRLMCQPIPPPPPSVAADQPPVGSQDAVCKQDRYAQHRKDAACAGCHALTDAVGFGLERFDNAGRMRTHDDGLPQCSIAGDGEIAGVGRFNGPQALGELLVSANLIAPCAVEQFLQFALGRPPTAADGALPEQLQRTFSANEFDFASLVKAYVTSDAFAQHTEDQP